MAEKSRDMRIERTTHHLKRALQVMLWNRSLEEVRVQDICAHAMVHRATFYTHYQDKYHLFQEILSDVAAEIDGGQPAPPEQSAPRQLYMAAAERAIDYVTRHRRHLRDTLRSNKDSMAYFMIYHAVQDYITALLERYQKTSAYLLPLEVISRFTTAGLTALVFYWVESDARYSKDEMMAMIETIISRNQYVDVEKSKQKRRRSGAAGASISSFA